MISPFVAIPAIKSFYITFSAALILVVYIVLVSPGVSAEGTATIAQGFKTDLSSAEAVSGAMVSTKSNSNDMIELASTKNSSRLVGVVDTKPLLTISSGENQIQVVLSGATQVLVSDINGKVKAGDRITASPLSGVGMRASTDGQVVGNAQMD